MTGNKAYLAEFQDFNGGPVAFGGSKGYITGKGKIKTGKLDFEDVCFVKELQHFNLFSVSQMCDKKNKVLFTDSECLVLSSEFKLPDENQATTDESNKWHRRLGHVNFKNLNKLVKGNLVRGLPSKLFQNDHTCVACQKGKQHKASCKAKTVSSISHSLQLLHMDLFGPTSVRSLNHKTYCLVITDDFSRMLTLEIPPLEDIYQNSTDGIFTTSSYDDEGAMVDFTNLEIIVNVSLIPTLRIHLSHLSALILGDPTSAVQTRSKVNKSSEAHDFVSYVQKQKRTKTISTFSLFICLVSCSNIKPKKILEVLEDVSWLSYARELLQVQVTESLGLRGGIDYDQCFLMGKLMKRYMCLKPTEFLLDLKYSPESLQSGSSVWVTSSSQSLVDAVLRDVIAFEESLRLSYDGTGSNPDTTCSILGWPISMAVLDSCPKHNMVAYLEKSEGNAEFHEIIDFLKRSSIHHALTVSPVVSTTFVEQFWTSDILFDDADGIDSLPNQLYLMLIQAMGHLDAKKKFVMYPRFISIFLDKQLANVSVPLDHFPINTLTSKVFSFMVKKGGPIEHQPNLSPRPSPTTTIPDSIPETSGENLGGHSSSDKSLSGNEAKISQERVFSKKHMVAQQSCIQREGSLLKVTHQFTRDPRLMQITEITVDLWKLENVLG
ncbi:putative ribonuclease H-like domain-containing protein [Tanacetum coccineum]